jgi:hypothetical protein
MADVKRHTEAALWVLSFGYSSLGWLPLRLRKANLPVLCRKSCN